MMKGGFAIKQRVLPDVGMPVWYVCEHFYYVPGHAGPYFEYVVCQGIVAKYYQRNCKLEFKVDGFNGAGHPTPSYFLASELDKKVFVTEKAATHHAQQLTDDYENKWSYMDPRCPLRRSWESFL